ncbi:MAG: DUF2914 domain-containing protein [bacterium]
MKKGCFILFVVVITLSLTFCHVIGTMAQGSQNQVASLTAPLTVDQLSVCRNIVDHEPVESGDRFEATAGKLYCFSKVLGATDPVEITHVWYFNDVERARVDLPIRSASWRTYSSKVIQLFEVGNWRVDVLGPNGEVLKSQAFSITK